MRACVQLRRRLVFPAGRVRARHCLRRTRGFVTGIYICGLSVFFFFFSTRNLKSAGSTRISVFKRGGEIKSERALVYTRARGLA